MTPTTAIQTCFRKYVTVSGRAGRSEFIWFTLFCVAVFAVLYYVEGQIWGWSLKNGTNSGILTALFHLIIALPFLTVMIRRTQDFGMHPAVVFLPDIAFYFRYELLNPIALGLETMQGLEGPEARAASYTNPIGQFVLWSRPVADYMFYLLVVLLIFLPTGFAQKFSFFSIPENETTP